MKPLVSVIIQSYNSRRYIEKCLDSLLDQDYPALEVLIIINGANDGSDELIRARAKRAKKIRVIEPSYNSFFSKGNNIGISESRGEYIFSLNQDTVLTQGFISKLVQVLEDDKTLGSVSGKLLHYDYNIDSRTKILDSTGIEIFRTRRVIDRGQWERDEWQYDADRDIFGASGAAALYRRSALEAVRLPKLPSPVLGRGGTPTQIGMGEDYEYFDESFIAYKEDIDLAWRLQLAGYGCRYVPEAIIYHGRTVGRSWPTQFIRFILNRGRQSRTIRKQSFKNHYLAMVKNELMPLFWRDFLYILVREFLLLVYSILFEPFQFFALIQFFRQLPEAKRKRKIIMSRIRANPRKLQKLFH